MIVLVLHAGSDRAVRVGGWRCRASSSSASTWRSVGPPISTRSSSRWRTSTTATCPSTGTRASRWRRFQAPRPDRRRVPGRSGRWLSVVAVVAIGRARRGRPRAAAARRGARRPLLPAAHRDRLRRWDACTGSPSGRPRGTHCRWPARPAGAMSCGWSRRSRWASRSVLRRVRDVLGSDLRRLFDGLLVVVALAVVIQQFDPARPYLLTGLGVGDGLHRLPRPARRRGHRPGRAGVPVRRQHRRYRSGSGRPPST